jgi:uncharacterized repeat protein (TIGR01451 family)
VARKLYFVALAAVALLALATATAPSPPAAAAPGESTTPLPNPDLAASCGIDILVILDESASIETAGATEDVRSAFRTLTSSLNNTGSRLAVVDFEFIARAPLAGAAQLTYTPVTDASIASTFEPYISTDYVPAGQTNWEDAFRVGRYFLPRPSQDIPHLVMFITDGNPNTAIRTDLVTYDQGNPDPVANEYEQKLPLFIGASTVDPANEVAAVFVGTAANNAVTNANALKAEGSHVLAVAVGDGLADPASLSRLVSVSGPDVTPDGGAFDIATTDVYREPDFAQLETALREAAFQLCASSVTVRKQVDQNPDPDVEDLQPGQGWDMTAEIAPTPDGWVQPAQGGSSTATSTTGADGLVTFQWEPSAPGDAALTVSEDIQPGYVNDPAASSCTYITQEAPTPQPLPGFAVTDGGFSGTVPENSIVTCEMVNRVSAEPAIDVEKATNGQDADAAPGALIPIGEAITWTYVVTNTGSVELIDIAVEDDQGVAVSCPETSLPPGASMTCTATGTATAGQYVNIATVTGEDSTGTGVMDEDPSNYFGVVPGIDIVKSTNGDDANLAPGPFIAVGEPVAWTYVVANTGDADLTGVVVTDDQGVAVTCPATTLAVGGSMTCTGTGSAVAGQYENVGQVTAFSVTEPTTPVQDSDPSHYFGESPGVALVKTTNGEDANNPTGPLIPVGDSVVWRYVMTNTGNVPLTYALTDDQDVQVACPRILTIAPGESLTCFAIGTAEAGQYANTGTVVGTAPSGVEVSADDPSHYFGSTAGIALVKSTNGEDANQAPGPYLIPGSPVTWTYVVTNTGNTGLDEVTVVDNPAQSITCPQTTLAAGESMTCTATGTAGVDQYGNLATATGTTPSDDLVRAVDPSHYFGAAPGVDIQKLTNGIDADEAPGVYIPVGERVDWVYEVTNSGNQDLVGVVVTDDQGVTVACPQTTLAVGESMNCTATGTAEEGQYENVGTVTADTVAPEPVTLTASDPSHYFGTISAIDITKYANGEDANTEPGVIVETGDPVLMEFVVTNEGNIPIGNVVVTDDRGLIPVFVSGDDDGDEDLDPGEIWFYEAEIASAPEGSLDNTGTVTGMDMLENSLTDDDPAIISAAVVAVLPPTGFDPTAPLVLGILSTLGGALFMTISAARRRIQPTGSSIG